MKFKSMALLMLTMAMPAMADQVTVNTQGVSLVLDVENGQPAKYLYFGARLDERDKANTARIAKLEKKLEQLLNKGAATSEPERDASETQEDYTPLLELDYATRPPKQ